MQSDNAACAVTQSVSEGPNPVAEILNASLLDSSRTRDGKRCFEPVVDRDIF